MIVTGKGGVGKSTVALALGLRAAAEGKRTIVCEVSAQEHASRVFHRAEVGFHEVEMAENLWAISIDPDESMREYVLLQLKVKAMRDLLFRSRIFNYLAAATPGAQELVTIGKIWELAQPDRKVKRGREYDLVIVDAPATGHGVGFLQTPRTFANDRPGRARSTRRPRRSTASSPTTRRPGSRSSRCPRRCRSTSRPRWSATLRDEVGVAVDRVYMNGALPGALLRRRGRAARRARGRAPTARVRGAAAARRSPSTAARARSATSSRACGAGSRAGQDAALHLRARARASRRAPALAESSADAGVDEMLEGKRVCICAGSGGVGKTTTSAAIAAGMAARGMKVCVLTIDPAKRLADSLGLPELGNEAAAGRPGAVRDAGGRDARASCGR